MADKPVNLLEENNINPNRFWLEPGELMQLATNFCLSPGYYAGRIQALFDFPSLTMRTIRKGRYTFETFTFAFEVPSRTEKVAAS